MANFPSKLLNWHKEKSRSNQYLLVWLLPTFWGYFVKARFVMDDLSDHQISYSRLAFLNGSTAEIILSAGPVSRSRVEYFTVSQKAYPFSV